jgi:hypothetical protein
VESERFRRTRDGYDPAEVDALIAEREARLGQLEREAQDMALRVIETEERMQGLLRERGDADRTAGPMAKVEEVYGQARRQATRIRMKALDDAVQIAERVTELTKLRDELGSKVTELAGKAGIKLGDEERPPVGFEPVGSGRVETTEEDGTLAGLYAGPVRIDFGPVEDFAQLTAFEDAVGDIAGVRNISVQQFSGGRATLAMSLEAPTELLSEMKERAPFEFRLREANGDGLVLDVVGEAAGDAGPGDAAFAQRPAAEHGGEPSTYSVDRPRTVLDERSADAA